MNLWRKSRHAGSHSGAAAWGHFILRTAASSAKERVGTVQAKYYCSLTAKSIFPYFQISTERRS